MATRSSAARGAVAFVGIAAAALLAACGSSGGATTTDALPDPLTQTIPASTIPADLPAEPGVLQLTGRPSTALDLVRTMGALGFSGGQGLSMAIRTRPSEADVLTALRSGSADAAVVSSDEALRLASEGAELRIVLLLTTVTSGEEILAHPNVPDVPSLVGRRIAYLPGGNAELLLRGTLSAADVPVTQVELVDAHGRDPGAMLTDGTADASVVDSIEGEAVLAGDATADAIATAGDQPGLLSEVLVVREEAAIARPGQLLAFVRAWQDLYRFDRDGADVVAASIARLQGIPVVAAAFELGGIALYDVQANAVDLLPGGEYHDVTLLRISAASTAAGWLAAPIDERALIDASFAQAIASQP